MEKLTKTYLIGTSGWTYDHWKGDFYPADLPRSRWFEYYAARFNSVEVNATFYRWFKDQTYIQWRDQVEPGFTYTLKVPQQITHRKYLQASEEDIANFWQSANLLEEKLGLILLQLAPSMPYDLERLRRALLQFGDPSKVAVEFRNKKWLKDETDALLCELKAIYCDVDAPDSELTGKVTSTSGYLRLHGRQRWYASNYSDEELAGIAEIARGMHTKGAQQVFIYFNNDIGGYAPRNALTLQMMLENG